MARRIARDLQVLAVACGSLVLVAVLTQLISPSYDTEVSSAHHHHHHHHHHELAEASTYKLVPTPLLSLNPNRKWHNAELAASYDRPTIGSDLVYLASSESDEGGFESGGRFLGLTDATPLKSKCPGDHHLTFLPFPDFSPGMVRLRLEPGRDGKGAMEMDSAIPLRGRSRFLTSTPPRSTGGSPEFLNSTFWGPEDENDAECRHRVSADPGGADTEGLAGPLPDGGFIVAEEYGPSLMRVAANGTVLIRFSPRPLNLPKAYYPVRPVLPSILVERRHNKGFESAFLLKPEQSQLACGILQVSLLLSSPLSLYSDLALLRSLSPPIPPVSPRAAKALHGGSRGLRGPRQDGDGRGVASAAGRPAQNGQLRDRAGLPFFRFLGEAPRGGDCVRRRRHERDQRLGARVAGNARVRGKSPPPPPLSRF